MKKQAQLLEVQRIMRFMWDKYEVTLDRLVSGRYSLTFRDTTRNIAADIFFFAKVEELEVKYNNFAPGEFLRLYVGTGPTDFADFSEKVSTYLGSEDLGPVEVLKLVEIS